MIPRTVSLFGRMVRPRVAITMWTFMIIGVARHSGPTVSLDLLAATNSVIANALAPTPVSAKPR